MTATNDNDGRRAKRVRDFVNTLVNSAEDVAIFETSNSDDVTSARLQQMRRNLERELTPLMGGELAGKAADAFCMAVMGEKREREALAAKRLL